MWGFLVGLFGWIWNGIQAVADAAIVALEWLYGVLKAGLLAVWDVAKFTWNDILKPIGQWLDAAYERLKAVYTAVIKPALDWLQRVTDVIRKVYDKFIRPILSTIDNVRRLLAILATFHVAFAQQLDNALTALEAKITKPLQVILSALNGLINRVESYVLTLDNLFHSATLLGSIGRDLNPVLNMQAWRMMGTLTEKQKDGPTGQAGLDDADTQIQFLEDVVNGKDDVTGIDVEAALTLMEKAFNGESLSMT